MKKGEEPVCAHCGYPQQINEHAFDCPTKKPKQAEGTIEGRQRRENGFVREAPAFFVATDSFVSLPGSEHPNLIHPLFFQRSDTVLPPDMVEKTTTAQVIPTMGRAAFIEQPSTFHGEKFNYLQWKGVGENPHNVDIEESARQKGATTEFPLGKKGVSPLMFVSADGRSMLRFLGGSFYEDLLEESENHKRLSRFGLRMPEIVGTIKFSRAFCEQQGLPMPDSDEPEDIEGQTLEAYLLSHKDEIDPNLYEKLLTSSEAKSGYRSLILGQNVRAFRNVWRAEDLERIMDATQTETEKEKAISDVFTTSRQIIGEELGRELDNPEFVKAYAGILGAQTGILLANKLDHGSLSDLKQNITLAGEVVDFDATKVIDEEYLHDEQNYPDWVYKDGVPQPDLIEEWRKTQLDELFRQVYYMASHLQPLLDGLTLLHEGGREIEMNAVEAFIQGLKGTTPPEMLETLRSRLDDNASFGTAKNLYTSYDGSVDEMKRKNFDGCKELFSRLNTFLTESI
ncbi:hypothetical protein CO174_03570 [Candidatus Uhrbacteria bacterium CG_4_9_14_3_um_filter_50_9]|uniref:Uncharacterized protein n=1 Tax=Candidatus Uhrbacteria bacterium CG_4_9_14_3_um_filter_50_9 TaxID=1975035 RepID=A0A2M7XBY0_9BACT|nr:MAG: hypothetical protein CO174_03570 [Candidatus Uhrbacteria bacterium CG_4_9_14_3_um_filter_50_9]